MTLKWLFTLSTFPLHTKAKAYPNRLGDDSKLATATRIYHECHSARKKSNYCRTIHITDPQRCQEKTTDPSNSRHSVCLMGELSEAWIYDVIHGEAKNNGFYFASLLLAGGLWIMSYRKRCRFSIYFCPCVSPCSNNSPVFFIQMSSPEFSVGGSTML